MTVRSNKGFFVTGKVRRNPTSLSLQMVIASIVLVMLTSLAIGIPAIWLIRQQLDRLAWTLVGQATQTTNTLLMKKQNELHNLATLTAERPTLTKLLESGSQEQLINYLETLRQGASLDLVMICDSTGQSIVQVGQAIYEEACQLETPDSIYASATQSSLPAGWLLSANPLPERPGDTVVVGKELNRSYLDQLRSQTEAEQIFLIHGTAIAETISYASIQWQRFSLSKDSLLASLAQATLRGVFTLDDADYYAAQSHYQETELEIIIALPVNSILEAQRQLTWAMAGGITIVALLSSALGILLAKRISQPLNHLRNSANALRKGDLATPITASSKVREIAQVAFALEDARIVLQHSLEQLREEKAWGEHLLESVVEGIITLDRQYRITFFSHGAERISGRKKEQVLWKSIDDVFQLANSSEQFSQRMRSLSGKQETLAVLVNNQPLSLAITGARLAPPEADKAHLALVLRDVSSEDAIRRLLGDFMANITHEFRTPLTAQAVSIELLLDQLDVLDKGELRELLTAQYLGVLSLQTLIDNLLEGASIEAGRFHVSPQPTELAEVIHETIQTLRPLLEKYDLQLQTDIADNLPLVLADPRRTSQVLINLVSNSIKWSPKGGGHRRRILLRAEVQHHTVLISVADEGPGIPSAQKQDLFTWLPNLQSKHGRADYGAGLGLSVVRAIVEAQGGRVGVEDAPEGGSIFWFTTPVVDKSSE